MFRLYQLVAGFERVTVLACSARLNTQIQEHEQWSSHTLSSQSLGISCSLTRVFAFYIEAQSKRKTLVFPIIPVQTASQKKTPPDTRRDGPRTTTRNHTDLISQSSLGEHSSWSFLGLRFSLSNIDLWPVWERKRTSESQQNII